MYSVYGFLDYKLHIDDPVGAVAVHCLNGIWGTIAVGFFATNTVPNYSIADADGVLMEGLFYGGGFKLLGLQLAGGLYVLWLGQQYVSPLYFWQLRQHLDFELQKRGRNYWS